MKNLLAIGIIVVGIAAYLFIVSSNGALEDVGIKEEGVDAHTVVDISGESFTAIDIRGPFEVTLVQDGTHDLQISGEENLVGQVRSEVSQGVLKVWIDKKIRKSHDLQLTIHSSAFEKMDIHGAVELSATTPIEGESLQLAISGASDVTLELQVADFEAGVSGAGDLNLNGTATSVDISISGAGNIDAETLIARHVEISISGAGNASVHADESLNVSISGVGNVTYSGDPAVEKHISGMGSLSKN